MRNFKVHHQLPVRAQEVWFHNLRATTRPETRMMGLTLCAAHSHRPEMLPEQEPIGERTATPVQICCTVRWAVAYVRAAK